MPASSSASASTQTPMSYERFRPRFPLDPFAGAHETYANAPTARVPWTLDADALPPPSILQHERRVVLVIGQPTGAALSPLFASPHLTSSLVIIATHRPPALPFDSNASIYTLRLRSPLAVADAGATRLVGVLEWALQVAQLWRRSGGPKRQELMEEVTPGSESVRMGESFGRVRYSVAPDFQNDEMPASHFSPAASSTNLVPSTGKKLRRQSLFKRKSSLPLLSDPASSKPFDALLHFLPADSNDKACLKAAILVTTLTRPYLAVPPTRAPSTRFYSESFTKTPSKSGKRWSFFRAASSSSSPASSSTSSTLSVPGQSKSTSDLPEISGRSSLPALALLRARRSRLLHLMPSGPSKASSAAFRLPAANSKQAHLVRSIEAFLLSFCFSASPDLPSPIAGFATSDAESAKARPYVMPASALAEILQLPNDDDEVGGDERSEDKRRNSEDMRRRNDWTLVELVLCGALESEAESTRSTRSGNVNQRVADNNRKGKETQFEDANDNGTGNETGWMAQRAWIGGVRDIVVVHSSSVKEVTKAHIATSRSNSQPQLSSLPPSRPPPLPPSQSHYPQAYSQSQSRVRPEPHSRSQPVLPQAATHDAQGQGQRNSNTNGNLNLKLNSKSALRVDTTTTRERKKGAYLSVGMEKRLPTPPEDHNGEMEEQDEDGGDSTISNATSCTRSRSVETGLEKELLHPTEEHIHSRARSLRRQSDRLVAQGSLLRAQTATYEPQYSSQVVEQQRSRLRSRNAGSASPYSSSSSPSSTTISPLTVAVSPPSRQHSGRRRHKPSLTSSHRHEVRIAEDGYDTEKQYMPSSSLPTPPDSEEASFDGVLDPVPSAVASSRVYEYAVPGAGGASPSLEHGRERGGRRREQVRDYDVDMDAADRRRQDKERERDLRRRTHSQPSLPIPAPAVPPRRAKTKPKERSQEGRLASDFTETKVDQLVRPEIKRNPSSGGGRRAKLEKSPRPERKRELSSDDRRGRGKRVPVPALEDVLPPLPRTSPSTMPSKGQAQLIGSISASQDTLDSSLMGTKNHTKWKFWKAGVGAEF